MEVRIVDLVIPTSNTTNTVDVSTVSAQSNAFAADVTTCLFTCDANAFIRQGLNPTALSDGTDMMLIANNFYRLRIVPGYKLAVIVASGTAKARITPGA